MAQKQSSLNGCRNEVNFSNYIENVVAREEMPAIEQNTWACIYNVH